MIVIPKSTSLSDVQIGESARGFVEALFSLHTISSRRSGRIRPLTSSDWRLSRRTGWRGMCSQRIEVAVRIASKWVEFEDFDGDGGVVVRCIRWGGRKSA
jgi:hypothetical protein